MSVDLFAGLCVVDVEVAFPWYGDLFGSEPAFLAHPKEAVWEVDEHRYVYVVERPENAGHGEATLFVEDLDERVAAIAARGIEPAKRVTYDNGVRKITYRDPDGNEMGLGGSA